MSEIKEFCREIYNSVYTSEIETQYASELSKSKSKKVSEDKQIKIETSAQKEAIKRATIDTMRKYPLEEPANIWKAVCEVHIHRKCGIDDSEIVAKVVSADQSWKKSSGHAFEEIIGLLGTAALEGTGISLILQRDLSTLLKAGEISNEPRDISWLKEQVKKSVFDLYAILKKDDGRIFCFGCIQSKTSIRDRVTRDREPSIQAMQSYFWSTAIVLDGDFLRLPKFISMVDGNSPEYPINGWHGLYVFSEKYSGKRIYSTNLDFKNFKEHAIKAAEYWSTQRPWFDYSWDITKL